MLILRCVFLGALLVIHVIGAAALFRRLFPRESPWLCFLVPPLGLVLTLNFANYFINLSGLGWLLPLTCGGLIWAMVRPGYSWRGLTFPTVIFITSFCFVYLLRCLSPAITNVTEAIFNMSRILNYDLSDKLPARDCWLPPYDYGRYYTFQHYGAWVLKELFSVDLGTAYNLAFAFLLAWVCVIGAGVAHSISGKRWVALGVLIILLSGSTGSVPLLILFGHNGADYDVSTCINDAWNDPLRNPFTLLCAQDQTHPTIKLLPPLYTIYYSEFHANLGGAFMTIAALFAASEVFKRTRSNWSWIILVALPWLVIITSTWFFFIVLLICVTALGLALLAGRRPEDWRFACLGAVVALILGWPSFYALSGNPSAPGFQWTTPEDRTPLWMFLVQWWPVWLPWMALTCIWKRLPLMGRWIHALLPLMLIGVEYVTIGNRVLTLEKMWGGLYAVGLVTLLPLAFMQRTWFFRILALAMIGIFAVCLGNWMRIRYGELDPKDFFRLQGDAMVQDYPQSKRIVQVLKSMHGKVVLPGKSYWDYNAAPAIVAFSENYCYVAYYFQEEDSGNGDEADYRNKLNNDFYDGKMDDPLPFLLSNNISAVLIWTEDQIPDAQLQKFQQQLASQYYYIDCKMDQPNNAGVFIRRQAGPTPLPPAMTPTPPALAPPPTPAPAKPS